MKSGFLLLFAFLSLSLNAQLFQQSFSKSFGIINTPSNDPYYVSSTPDNTQFSFLGSTGPGFDVSVPSSGIHQNKLLLQRHGGDVGGFVRNASFSSPTSVLYISFDLELIQSDSQKTSALMFAIGNNFSNDAFVEPTSKINSRFGISFSPSLNGFSITNVETGVTDTNVFYGNQKVLMVINRSAATAYYYNNNKVLQSVGKSKFDLFIGDKLIYNEALLKNASVPLNHFKMSFNEGTGTVAITNILLDFPPVAPLTTAATNISSSGFTANWNAAPLSDAYFLDVSASSGFASYLSGYQNKFITGDSIDISGLQAGITYYYRLRSMKIFGTDTIVGGNSKSIAVKTAADVPVTDSVVTISSVTSTGARLTGKMNSLSGGSFVQKGFVLSKLNENNNPLLGGDSVMVLQVAGNKIGAYSFVVSGLENATDYVVKAFATNSVGTSYSNLYQFSTLSSIPNAYPGNLSFSDFSTSGYKLSWKWTSTADAPDGYIVVRRTNPGAAYPATLPANGMAYNVGDVIGDGTVVFSGNDSSAVISGLLPGTGYGFTIYPYNGSGTNIGYRTVSSGISRAIRYTLSLPPAAHPSFINADTYNQTTATISFPPASSISNATGYLILKTAGNATPDTDPLNGQAYAVNNILGNSTVIGIVTNQTSFNIGGLATNTQYRFSLIPFDSASLSTQTFNYLSDTPLTSIVLTTLIAEPTASPKISFSDFSQTSLTVNWTNVSHANGYLVIRNLMPGNSVLSQVPQDLQNYVAGDTIGDALVIFSGFANSVNDTGLIPANQYTYFVFPYASNANGINYRTTSPAKASRFTASELPAGYPSSLTVSSYNQNYIALQFSAANTIANAKGYMILRRTGNVPSSAWPTDGNVYSVNKTIGNNTIASIIYDASETNAVITGLSANTVYTFTIIPFDSISESTQTFSYLVNGTPAEIVQSTLIGEPSTASVFSFTNVTTTTMNVNWSAAKSATGYLLLQTINSGTDLPDSMPNDFMVYSVGDTLGNAIIKYIGTNRTFALTGLAPVTPYSFAVYPYAQNATGINYRHPGTSATQYTSVDDVPLSHAGYFSASDVTSNSLKLSFSPAGTITNAKGYVIIYKAGSAPADLPVNGTAYFPGMAVGKSRVAALIDNITDSFTIITGLTDNTMYYFRIYPYNRDAMSLTTSKFNTSPVVPQTYAVTLPEAPAASPSNLVFSLVTTNSMKLSWTASTATPKAMYYLVLQTKGGTGPNTQPPDSISYLPGDSLGNAKVVYTGSAVTTVLTGLESATKYNYAIYAYRNTGAAARYHFTPLTGSKFTIADTPSAPINIQFVNTTNSIKVSWQDPADSPDGYLVLRTIAAGTTYPNKLPVNGTNYAVGDVVGNAKVVFAGPGNQFTDLMLATASRYNYHVFSYNGSLNDYTSNFLTAAYLQGNYYTLSEKPSAHAQSFDAQAMDDKSILLTFSPAATISNAKGFIITMQSGFNPINASLQNAHTYNVGDVIGNGKIVAVTNNTASSIVVNGLDSLTTYSFNIIPYNELSGIEPTYHYNSDINIPFDTATTMAPQTLNIVFVNAKAAFKEGVVVLDWMIDNNEKEGYFEVEKSLNNNNWNAIEKIKLSEKTKYQCIDKTVTKGMWLYRIAYYNKAGKRFYSNTMKVDIQGKTAVEVYPNPARDFINVSLNGFEAGKYKLKLIDFSGRIIKQIEIGINGNNEVYKMELKGMVQGNYILMIEGKNVTTTSRIFKN